MSTSTLALERSGGWLARAADYFELAKPKIAALVLVTVAASGIVARWGQPAPLVLLHTLLGTFLVAASASIFNQILERHTDALMERTANRPLTAGRVSAQEATFVGALSVVVGLAYLAILVNWPAAVCGLITWVLYVCIYTPLKRWTSLNTAIGAVAGAMPILIGWTAAGGSIDPWVDPRGAAVFSLVFLWQFPHFMAIAWIYRQQYANAKLQMLTVVDQTGRRAGLQAVVGALALLPVSFVPALYSPGSGASLYLAITFALGTSQLLCSLWFLWNRNTQSARWLLRASLIYLPAQFALLVCISLL